MAGVSKRLSFLFAIAIGVTFAGCGGLQQASAPLPGSAVSHRASSGLPRSAKRQPLLYVSCDFICTNGPGNVDIYPLTGPNKGRIGRITNGIKFPWGLSIDSNNSLYVANAGGLCCPRGGNGTVTVYPYGSTNPSMTYSKGVQHPFYPLADSAGHVFVSGYSVFGHRSRGYVFEYNAGTNVPIAHAQLGAEDDGIAEDANGNLYVAYRQAGPLHNASIVEFGPGLTNKRLLGMKLHAPEGLLVDRAGNILVVEVGRYYIPRIDVFPPGATNPSVTVGLPKGPGGQLAMQNNETTLWVSVESFSGPVSAYVYYMPYPLTPSTKPTQYGLLPNADSHGIAVSPQ